MVGMFAPCEHKARSTPIAFLADRLSPKKQKDQQHTNTYINMFTCMSQSLEYYKTHVSYTEFAILATQTLVLIMIEKEPTS